MATARQLRHAATVRGGNEQMDDLRRRSLLALGFPPAAARAQPGWPTRPIRIIAAYPPGGGVDVPTRLLAPGLQTRLGQPIVVENRAGAAGAIGAAAVAGAAPDGYTLLTDASGPAVNPLLRTGLGFDYDRDLAPIGLIAIFPMLLVVPPASPWRDVAGLVAAAKADPGAVTYASSGVGNGTHLAGALLARRAGVTLTHVPYRGSSLVTQDLIANNVACSFQTMAQSAPLVREGRLRALAITTPERIAGFKDIPTVAEQGFPGFEIAEFVAMWTPAATPAEVVARLGAAMREAVADTAVTERLRQIGMQPVGGDPAGLARFVARQRATLGELIRAEGIRLE